MRSGFDVGGWVRFAMEFADEVLKAPDLQSIESLLEAAAREMGFRHYAMIHHDDHAAPRPGLIFMQNYPALYAERYVADRMYRDDPVIHTCHIIDRVFRWSEIGEYLRLTERHRRFLERGAREGVCDGITVPSYVFGERGASCNFAGPINPDRACKLVDLVANIASFAFQGARKILLGGRLREVRAAGLQPRERECIIWAAQAKSNTDIGKILGLSPATVKFYLENAYRRYDVTNRTQLAIAAMLDGEIGIHEILPGRYRFLAQ